MDQYDVIIVGGGPNGLACGHRFLKEMPSKKILILEKNKIVNSLRQYPDVLWHSTMNDLKLPSYLNNSIEDKYNPTSSELVKYYEHFATEHDLNILEGHEVIDIRRDKSKHLAYDIYVKCNNETLKFNSKIIILSTGIYRNRRKLSIKSDYEYCKYEFELGTRNKKLLLVGAGNSATDYIIHLLPKNKITWVIRDSTWKSVNYKLSNQFNDIINLYSDNLTLYLNTSIQKLSVDRKAILSNQVVINDIDECSLFLGYNSINRLFEKIGLEFDHECLKLNEGYETNLENIYAFGSIMAQWDGKAPKQTYIHNGNMPQLKDLMGHIIDKEITKIMNSNRVNPSATSITPMIKRNFFQKVMGRLKRIFSINDIKKYSYDKVMIVTHPDDETLWGGNALEQEQGWFVVCLTNGDNRVRSKQFNKAMDVFQVDRNIYNFPDLGADPFPTDILKDLEVKLRNIVNQPSIKKVVTHGPDGEYGHPAHKTVASLVKRVIVEENNLHYFSFSKPGVKSHSVKKQKAFDIYFGSLNGGPLLLRLVRCIVVMMKYSLKFVLNTLKLKTYDLSLFREQITKTYKGKIEVDKSIIEHCNLSRFENIVHHSKYKNYDEILNEIYFERRLPNNARDVYLENRKIYDDYPDRKFIITEYLPACVGKTLGVGCHVFNKNDAKCLPKPSDYETIDLTEKWKIYGSPYKHTTGDFLTYLPGYKFNHIILFGVLGIPFQSDGDDDIYTMYDSDKKVVEHVDQLLNINGTVLFGPDISIDQSKSTKEKMEYWNGFFNNNKILKNKYELVKEFNTETNFIIVCKKTSL